MAGNPVLNLGLAADPGVLCLTFFDQPYLLNGILTVIGSDDATLLALDAASRVMSVDEKDGSRSRFVNSTPEALLRCVRSYQRYAEEISATTSEDGELGCVRRLEHAIRKADELALADDENWWACVVGQAYEGNL